MVKLIFFCLRFRRFLYICIAIPKGEMAEWSNAVVLKTIVPQGTGGSNPSLSASIKAQPIWLGF
tara:strand:+ start:2269 stop:2460 length:192 start_codon:yes stop_codon:yes gene_type:complete